MISLTVNLKGFGAWPDITDKERLLLPGPDAPPMQVAVLPNGTAEGRPSVAIRVDLPDGKIMIAETSARLFCTAAKMIMAKHPDLFEGD